MLENMVELLRNKNKDHLHYRTDPIFPGGSCANGITVLDISRTICFFGN